MSLVLADARRLPLRDACVQCIVTSPPYYGLRDYGTTGQLGLEATPGAYVDAIRGVFDELWRVLREDGVCWLNMGDSYGPHKELRGIPWRVAFALQGDGWCLRSEVIWHKPNPMPESVTDRPTKAHEYVFLLTKSERYFYDADAIAEPLTEVSLARYERVGRNHETYDPARHKHGDESMHNAPMEVLTRAAANVVARGTRNKRSVWTVPTLPYAGAHFATMPEALVEPCILAGSRLGDMVLDPFMGSGTVGAVAARLGRRWVGTDLNQAYHALAQERTAQRGLPLEEAGV